MSAYKLFSKTGEKKGWKCPQEELAPGFPSLFPNKWLFSSFLLPIAILLLVLPITIAIATFFSCLCLFVSTASAAFGIIVKLASRSSLMRVEAGELVPELDGRISSGSKSAKKKKRHQKKQASSAKTAVRRLFEACEDVFSDGRPGGVPSAGDVEKIRSVLDSMKPSDVNLTPNILYFGNSTADVGSTAVRYIHIYECDNFSMGIFFLPPSGVIPLHNHPGMTVFSKLLFGSMHIKSYDWADVSVECNGNDAYDTRALMSKPRLAKVKTDAVFKAPCKTSILYPAAGGNIHCFSALTPCAVLDVLGPPYCDTEGRHCAYYRDFRFSSSFGVIQTSYLRMENMLGWKKLRGLMTSLFLVQSTVVHKSWMTADQFEYNNDHYSSAQFDQGSTVTCCRA